MTSGAGSRAGVTARTGTQKGACLHHLCVVEGKGRRGAPKFLPPVCHRVGPNLLLLALISCSSLAGTFPEDAVIGLETKDTNNMVYRKDTAPESQAVGRVKSQSGKSAERPSANQHVQNKGDRISVISNLREFSASRQYPPTFRYHSFKLMPRSYLSEILAE